VTRLGIPHAVDFAGWEDNPIPHMKKAYLTLVPSYYEGWGMVAVESLVAGTPVIMTNVGCAGELIKPETGGEITPVGDKKKLRSAVTEFLANDKKQQKYSKRTKNVIKYMNTREEYLNKLQAVWQKTAFMPDN
jgi:glycogen(starch) synthase